MKEFDDFSSDLFITHPHATFEKWQSENLIR
jgi:hypothetical protein